VRRALARGIEFAVAPGTDVATGSRMSASPRRSRRLVPRRRPLVLAPEAAILRRARTSPPADVQDLIASLESLVASLRATVGPAGLRLVDPPGLASPLTAREREIIVQLSNGYAAINIAARLDLSYTTVRNHIQNTLRKLEVHSQVEAVALSFRSGWI
jgi:DNA-binding NarL/FixJ family response regulator